MLPGVIRRPDPDALLLDVRRLGVVEGAGPREDELRAAPGDGAAGREPSPRRVRSTIPRNAPDGDDCGVLRSRWASNQSTAAGGRARIACCTAASSTPQSPPITTGALGTAPRLARSRSRTADRRETVHPASLRVADAERHIDEYRALTGSHPGWRRRRPSAAWRATTRNPAIGGRRRKWARRQFATLRDAAPNEPPVPPEVTCRGSALPPRGRPAVPRHSGAHRRTGCPAGFAISR